MLGDFSNNCLVFRSVIQFRKEKNGYHDFLPSPIDRKICPVLFLKNYISMTTPDHKGHHTFHCFGFNK